MQLDNIMGNQKYTCLMFHQTTLPAVTKYYIGIDAFEQQIKRFVELKGISFIPNMTKIDNQNVPVCLFTFDDGHKSNLEAGRILAKYGLRGIFYVVKDFSLHNSDFLNETNIKELASMKQIIAVHGKDHLHWSTKPDKQLVNELRETKEWIENLTGEKVFSCAAPGGVINKRVIETIKQELPEFKFLRTVKVGDNINESYLINIIPIHTSTTLADFEKAVLNDKVFYTKQKFIYRAKEVLRPIYNLVGNK